MEKEKQTNFGEIKIRNFYETIDPQSPLLVAIYTLITLGFYAIQFIYDLNKNFEQIDPDSPDSKRCLFVMLYIPAFWFFLVFTDKYLTKDDSIYMILIKIIFSSIVVLLILKYVYDFSLKFAEFTQSSATFWFFSFFPYYLFITLISLGFFDLGIVVFIISISAFSSMQNEINKRFEQYSIYKGKMSYNSIHRIYSN